MDGRLFLLEIMCQEICILLLLFASSATLSAELPSVSPVLPFPKGIPMMNWCKDELLKPVNS